MEGEERRDRDRRSKESWMKGEERREGGRREERGTDGGTRGDTEHLVNNVWSMAKRGCCWMLVGRWTLEGMKINRL